jgi:hypothetical protein
LRLRGGTLGFPSGIVGLDSGVRGVVGVGGMRRLLVLAVLLVFAPAARATTLVNDPAHPFSVKQMVQMQRWVDVAGGRVRTVPGTIVMSHRDCTTTDHKEYIGACALGHEIDMPSVDRYTELHELGHEDQMFDGLGDATNYPGMTGWTATKKATVASMLHMPTGSAVNWFFNGDNQAVAEVSADAYAECALRRAWVRWWGHRGSGPDSWVSTTTPYDFEAGPRRFARICDLLRGP